MGDFFLDFREPAIRRASASKAVAFLKFFNDMRAEVIERDAFTLVLTSADSVELWGSCAWQADGQRILVALAGRVALDDAQWDASRGVRGPGGLACKAILALYRAGGVNALTELNGNFVCLVHDEAASKVYLVSDRCGMTLIYSGDAPQQNSLVFSSHPDALASALSQEQQLDQTSLAEFVMTGRLTFPHTYYRNVHAKDPGCIHTLAIRNGSAALESTGRYFEIKYEADPMSSESDLAGELASAFRKAIRRRAHPRLGPVGLGLSGGLDSRAILCSMENREQVMAFTLFDEENPELRTAKAIADACGVDLVPIRRPFEYYGQSANLGVKISGGMGCVASNHFLGVRDFFRERGVQNLLTGCYCDYWFKGLALNTKERRVLRTEQFAGFRYEFYRPCYWLKSAHSEEVQARLKQTFPESSNGSLTESDWLHVERKRSFPLAYEADSAQRVIPQRVMPWFVPIADNDILDVYRRIPPRFKLNGAIFRKMVRIICGKRISEIADSNTGAAVLSSRSSYVWHRYATALRNKLAKKVRPSMATCGSWPNWEYYAGHSQILKEHWRKFSPTTREILDGVLGKEAALKPIHEYRGREVELFLRLWTLGLWLEQRT